MQNQKNIFGLDFMRAVAILMVLSSHSLLLFDTFYFKGIEIFHFFGFFGVEIFFVLSGFLIGNILYKNYLLETFSFKSLKTFWMRRWLRTFPNYFLALFINLFLAFFVWENIPKRIWSYFLFLQNSTTQPEFFNESCSITIEEYAYILFPICLILLIKKSNKNISFLLATIFLLLVFLFTKWYFHSNFSQNNLNHWNINLKAVLWYRIDAIIYGVLGAWIVNNYNSLMYKFRIQLLLIGLIFVSFLLFGIGFFKLTIQNYPLFWNVFYLPITSLSIFFSLPFFNSWSTFNSIFKKPIVLISKISYSIYLFHYYILLYLYRIIFEKYINKPFESIIYIFGYLSLVFMVSYLIYNYYEKPILKWRDKNYL